MYEWEWESVDSVASSKLWRVQSASSIRGNITDFRIFRRTDLSIALEVEISEYESGLYQPPPGSVVRLGDALIFEHISGYVAHAEGLYQTSSSTTYGEVVKQRLELSVGKLTVAQIDKAQERFCIEWIANCPSYWIYPAGRKTNTTVHTIRQHGRQLTSADMVGSSGSGEGSNNCFEFTIEGVNAYLCIETDGKIKDVTKAGYIFYDGIVSAETREKVRNALSFVLGRMLVHLGSTTFSDDWEAVEAESIDPYDHEGIVFRVSTYPLAPIWKPVDRKVIDPDVATAMLTALIQSFDRLELGSIGRAYWAAVCSSVEIAPLYFGTAIEALQRSYSTAEPATRLTKMLDDDRWSTVKDRLLEAFDAQTVDDDEVRQILRNKISGLNGNPPSRASDQIAGRLGLVLSPRERGAWKRRNQAGHGNRLRPDDAIDHMKDTKLLRLRLHRLLLAMTGAHTHYIDYYSTNLPSRRITDPIP